jgi:pimeloyl-ACP methyl ester carboxylesterase
MYSGQAYGIFHGDLDFYFGGFDARDRVASIDVKKCPIYFLTGEYDWSTTPEMSQATAKKIQGANFSSMKGLGHFPATEDPQKFVSVCRASASCTKQVVPAACVAFLANRVQTDLVAL